MATFASPGVFIEETANAPQVIQTVGTSTMAIVGWTPQGPTDDATLVTSPDNYTRTFGVYTNQSLVPLSVSAFFQNGGTRLYVVRVVPSDAVAATGAIASIVTGEQIGATMDGATPKTVSGTLTYIPVKTSSATVHWTPKATAVTAENPAFSPAEDALALGPFVATLANTKITNDTITLHWLESTVAKTATLTSANALGGANAANLSSASLVRTTGVLTITFAGGHPPDANSITVDYTPVGTPLTVTDDGAGNFTAAGTTGTIVYATGVISLTFTGATVVPYNGSTVTVDYTGNIWGLKAANKGVWGSGVRLTLSGNPNFFVYGTTAVTNAGAYTKFDVTISQLNSSSVFEVKETYEELVFNSATDSLYFADVINHGSDLVAVTDTGFLNVPNTFKGISHLAEVVGAGNGSTKTFSYTIGSGNRPIVKTSPVFHYTQGAVPHTATANTAGTISGTGIDSTKTNTIDYTTGVVTLNFSTAPDNSTNITVDYITMPTTKSVNYDLTGGSDGTISLITELTVSNNAALKSGKLGMYALDRVDEMMQLVIPDFAGDASVQSDMIDYAEARKDLFCILTTPKGLNAQNAVEYQQITLNKKSKYAAMYWPWVIVQDPLSATRKLTVPAVGHIAGIYARTDNNKNVSKAPAGTVDGALRGILGLESDPDKGDLNTVSPARINSLINTPGTGLAVWGARTMTPVPDATIYIQAVRLFIFVEKSVFNSTQNYVFESISGGLYTTIKTQLDSFLSSLFNQGYFSGSSKAQAYQVVCDTSNNPPEVVDAGQVIVDVGIAPTRPAEFLRIRIAQKAIS